MEILIIKIHQYYTMALTIYPYYFVFQTTYLIALTAPICNCIPRQVLPEDTLDSAALRRRRRAAASHSCVRSNSCISWQISFKFCMKVYLDKIYTPVVLGDAAPSVSSFIGSKVIFWWKSFVRSAGHISWWISFKFCTDVHHSQIYTPIVLVMLPPVFCLL